jgi:Galactose mutarotase and related enzymes
MLKNFPFPQNTLSFLLVILISAIITKPIQGISMTSGERFKIRKEVFGKTSEGEQVDIYTLTNPNGMKVKISTFGAAITELWVPDKNGVFQDVVLGYGDLEGYEKDNAYLGFTVGRYANRIGDAKFTLNGIEYNLTKNDGKNQLHGGTKGFNKMVWSAKSKINKKNASITLVYKSKDGEQGFPGNLTATVKFTLTEFNELQIEYSATTDKTTVVNLTNHAYFNLSGAGNGNILNHKVQINADAFTPVNENLIPTGEIRSVAGTPLDFTKLTDIGSRINSNYEQIILGKGYDHNWVLNKRGKRLTFAARAVDTESGRILEVKTKEPGIQFYTGNFLDGTAIGKEGKAYKYRYGFCFETQHFPDSPNKPKFPSVVLEKGKKYSSKTTYTFYTEKK